jgi:hypothetical protein
MTFTSGLHKNIYFKNKAWCDAKDFVGEWRLGKINKETNHGFLI